jgi:hypothetical protein
MRRTFAKLSHKGGADVHQIQKSLGHSSLVTTETYLGVDQSLTDAPADHLGIDFSPRDLPIAGFAAIRTKQKKAVARPRGSKKPGGSEAQ